MGFDDNYYRNCVLCGMKSASALGNTELFSSGYRLLIDSSIPTSQKLGTSLAIITAITIALISDTSEMVDNSVWLPLQPSKIAKRIIHTFCKIKQQGTYNVEDMEMQLATYFHGKQNSILFKRPMPFDDQSEIDDVEPYVSKEILSAPGLIYMETVPGSSKTKENITRIKILLEFRLFLRAIGIQDVTKVQKVGDIHKYFSASTEELRYQLSEKFDNRIYTKDSVEETMSIDMIDLLQDIPYASQVLDSIFAVSPYQ